MLLHNVMVIERLIVMVMGMLSVMIESLVVTVMVLDDHFFHHASKGSTALAKAANYRSLSMRPLVLPGSYLGTVQCLFLLLKIEFVEGFPWAAVLSPSFAYIAYVLLCGVS